METCGKVSYEMACAHLTFAVQLLTEIAGYS